MNRPNKNSMKYFMGEHEYFYVEYVNDLEKYCDELEKQIRKEMAKRERYEATRKNKTN